jgi:membrane-associated phospholipid phosphatase
MLLGWLVKSAQGSDGGEKNPCKRPIDSYSVRPRESIRPEKPSSADRRESDHGRPAPATQNIAKSRLCLASLEQNLFSDQKAIWTSPLRLHSLSAEEKGWLLPAGVGTLGLLASDQSILRHFGNLPVAHSDNFGNIGLAVMAGGAASFFLSGVKTNDVHGRETGLLSGEAAVNSVIVGEVMKMVFQRPRPNEANAGSFGVGGASFPSEHALAAWSIATVIAHEYPGRLTKLLAYSAASGISLSRVAARQHFPSDVVVGSALGYLIGRYVYREHHDPELPGANANDFGKHAEEKDAPRTRKPSEYGSPYVPLDSWVYAAFDRLAAFGYAPSAYANLRPWTRMECARIVAAAGDDLDAGFGMGWEMNAAENGVRQSEAYRLNVALTLEFANELARFDTSVTRLGASSGSGLGTGEDPSVVHVDSVYTRYLGISGTPLDDGYHFGQTLINDYGRLYGTGSNLISGASASGTSGPFAFYVRGEYQHAAPLPAYSQSVQQLLGAIDVTPPQLPIHTTVIDRFRLIDAYAAFNLKTVQISAGRQSLWWGPSHGGPANFSDNAEPMDMVRLTNPSPWKLPGFLHWLGPMRWDFFFGLMAGHHYPANLGVDGQKISFKPTPNLEFGFSRSIVFRPVTFHMFWRGFSSFGDNKTTIPGSSADVGDRRGGFDFSYRVPGLRKWMVIYNDGMTDDDTSPLGAPQRSLMNPGIYLPRIPKISKLDFRAEMVWSDPPELSNREGKYVYYNGAYHDSYTNSGHLIGSWVGREGHGVQLWSTYWLSPRNPLQIGYRKAHVDRDFIPSGGNIQDFFVRATMQLRSGMEVNTFLQYERWNFPILSPLAGPNTVASVEFTYHPKWSKALHLK